MSGGVAKYLRRYRELDEKERLRDFKEFLRWLLTVNKGRLITVSAKNYNRWVGGYGPLGAPEVIMFNRLVERVFRECGVRVFEEKFEVKKGNYTRHRKWIVPRAELERLLRQL